MAEPSFGLHFDFPYMDECETKDEVNCYDNVVGLLTVTDLFATPSAVIVVTSLALKEIDIQTCTKYDIPFDLPSAQQIEQNDYAQALVSVTFFLDGEVMVGAKPHGTRTSPKPPWWEEH